ncbi:3-hydroxyacyl-CoA dehydrogenase family protein [Agrobacterium tumefaciens]|uniref:3-hydroxybutyryl-CoA dehydrogenase n=1 Tax=Agrobacterium tumefaciens TaxID=358 RepID=A0A2L2LMK9_AGRTU|nr:3-hydroxyacyl-CoA dehydrogenase NAD-binding domain-containing protein [Agrobacterium tumefaciens]AVH45580.1 3-hydroxybutyryl-CoA dehydrogenase [Agrobacterium tumefaciens]NSY99374.1 hypothetical protein [Agrobacterium tumefaciens]
MNDTPFPVTNFDLPRTVACVGVGLIGASWVAVFAAAGLDVIATDADPTVWTGALDAVERDVNDLKQIGIVAEDWKSRVRFESDLEAAVACADFIQESGPENLASKKQLFARLDRAARAETIIASSTSGISMTEIQKECRHPGRCVVGHPFTPVHLVPLIEVVRGAETTHLTEQRASHLYRSVGKTVVQLRRDVPGFIGNRFQAVVLQEALSLVCSGVATVEEVDRAFTQGPGFRWAIYGPFALLAFSAGNRGLAAALRNYHINRDEVLSSIERVTVDDELIDKIESEAANITLFRDTNQALHDRNDRLIQLRRALLS